MGLEEIGALTPIIAIINNKKKKMKEKTKKDIKPGWNGGISRSSPPEVFYK